VVDLPDLLLAHPDRDELRELLVLADHAERPVPRLNQLRGRLDDPPQHGLQLQARADRDDRLQQGPGPVLGTDHRL
jgi:hypothetical protein